MDEPDAAGIEDPLASPYATAKWAGVAYGQMFHRVYGTPVVIARTFRTYGPGQHATSLVPTVILSLLRDQPPELANGDSMADWVYIDDVIDGFPSSPEPRASRAAYSSSGPGSPGRTGGGGGDRGVDRERGRAFVRRHPQPRSEPERVAMPDDSKAVLGWEAKTTLRDGLERTVRWYASQSLCIVPMLRWRRSSPSCDQRGRNLTSRRRRRRSRPERIGDSIERLEGGELAAKRGTVPRNGRLEQPAREVVELEVESVPLLIAAIAPSSTGAPSEVQAALTLMYIGSLQPSALRSRMKLSSKRSVSPTTKNVRRFRFACSKASEPSGEGGRPSSPEPMPAIRRVCSLSTPGSAAVSTNSRSSIPLPTSSSWSQCFRLPRMKWYIEITRATGSRSMVT